MSAATRDFDKVFSFPATKNGRFWLGFTVAALTSPSASATEWLRLVADHHTGKFLVQQVAGENFSLNGKEKEFLEKVKALGAKVQSLPDDEQQRVHAKGMGELMKTYAPGYRNVMVYLYEPVVQKCGSYEHNAEKEKHCWRTNLWKLHDPIYASMVEQSDKGGLNAVTLDIPKVKTAYARYKDKPHGAPLLAYMLLDWQAVAKKIRSGKQEFAKLTAQEARKYTTVLNANGKTLARQEVPEAWVQGFSKMASAVEARDKGKFLKALDELGGNGRVPASQ